MATTELSPNRAQPLGDGTYSIEGGEIIDVNEREMFAEFVVSSNVEDREGDVLEPNGCLPYLSEFKSNPVWLHEHTVADGPIGLATDSRGSFHFNVGRNQITARCYFHCKPFKGVNLSEEIFVLVKEGVLKGASPGFLPIETENRGYGRGKRYTNWRLTEISITSQPVNQEALRRALSRGVCKSMTLLPRLKELAMNDDEDQKLLNPDDASAIVEHCQAALGALDNMIDQDDSDVLKRLQSACEDVVAYFGSVHETVAEGSDVDEAKSIALLRMINKKLSRR